MNQETTTALEVLEDVSEDLVQEVQINGMPIALRETALKRGKAKGNFIYIPEIDLTSEDPFENIKLIVGQENWNREIFKLVRQAGIDASHDARDKENSTVNLSTYGVKFIEQFTPGSRRSGTGIKQLRERQHELFNELQPFMISMAKQEELTESENNRYLQLLVEYSDINEKIEDASRHGKGKKAAAAK